MSINEQTSIKEVLNLVCQKLGKPLNSMEKIDHILEDENWITNVEALLEIDEAQWRAMKIPVGVENAIKKILKDVSISHECL